MSEESPMPEKEHGAVAQALLPTEGQDAAVLDWKEAATGLCEAVLKQAPSHIQKVSDALYEGLLNDVQAYLRENVDYNLSGELSRAKADAARAHLALQGVAIELGRETYGFPNYPTPEMVADQCVEAITKLRLPPVSPAEQVGETSPSDAVDLAFSLGALRAAKSALNGSGVIVGPRISMVESAIARLSARVLPTPPAEGSGR